MLSGDLPSATNYDAVVLCVSHAQYLDFDYVSWMSESKALLFDANGVLTKGDRIKIRAAGIRVEALGVGEGL
jgi:UDP-N-acetyl-D-mannosaminuronate dehydrogenase